MSEDVVMNCLKCGQPLLKCVIATVNFGGPQICGPCIDLGEQCIDLVGESITFLMPKKAGVQFVGHGAVEWLREFCLRLSEDSCFRVTSRGFEELVVGNKIKRELVLTLSWYEPQCK